MAASEVRTYTRRQLYEIVWSSPIEQVADRLGLFVHDIQAVCDHHRVPLPKRSYWANLRSGKPTKQTIFVDVPDDAELNKVLLPPPHLTLTAEEERLRSERFASVLAEARKLRPTGFTPADFRRAAKVAKELGCTVELTSNGNAHQISPPASVADEAAPIGSLRITKKRLPKA